MRKKSNYYSDITGSETEEDSFQKNNEMIKKGYVRCKKVKNQRRNNYCL